MVACRLMIIGVKHLILCVQHEQGTYFTVVCLPLILVFVNPNVYILVSALSYVLLQNVLKSLESLVNPCFRKTGGLIIIVIGLFIYVVYVKNPISNIYAMTVSFLLIEPMHWLEQEATAGFKTKTTSYDHIRYLCFLENKNPLL